MWIIKILLWTLIPLIIYISDKFKVIKQKWNRLLFHGIEKTLYFKCHFFSAFEKLLISLCFVKGAKALLTHLALENPYPDKSTVIKLKWNSLLFYSDKKEIPTHLWYAVSLILIAIFFCLQAGKHGLFLNILLFGKLPAPNGIQPAFWHSAFPPIPPVKCFSFFSKYEDFLRNS